MNGQQQEQTTNIKDKPCRPERAEVYVNDLFELLEMKGQNEKLFTEMCRLLMRYKESIIQQSWKEIIFSCELPNGQIAGKLPPLWKIENIIQSKNINKFETQHKVHKTDIAGEGTIRELFRIGKKYSTGEIDKKELEKMVEDLK